MKKVKKLKEDGLETLTWGDLLSEAKRQWQEFLDHLVERSPNDKRIHALVSPEMLKNTEGETVQESTQQVH